MHYVKQNDMADMEGYELVVLVLLENWMREIKGQAQMDSDFGGIRDMCSVFDLHDWIEQKGDYPHVCVQWYRDVAGAGEVEFLNVCTGVMVQFSTSE